MSKNFQSVTIILNETNKNFSSKLEIQIKQKSSLQLYSIYFKGNIDFKRFLAIILLLTNTGKLTTQQQF